MHRPNLPALTRTGLATLVAGGILGAGVAGTGVLVSGAFADQTSTTSAAPSGPGGPQRPDRAKPPNPMERNFGGFGGFGSLGMHGTPLHGEFVVGKAGGGTRTVLVQQGKVTARDGSSVTVRSTDGYTLKWAVDKNSWVQLGLKQGSLDGLVVGDEVSASGSRSGSGATADFLARRPKAGEMQFGGKGPRLGGGFGHGPVKPGAQPGDHNSDFTM